MKNRLEARRFKARSMLGSHGLGADEETPEQGQRAFQGSFSTEEVIFYSSWTAERNVLGRTEWCSASETLPNNPIWDRSQRWAVRLCPTQI